MAMDEKARSVALRRIAILVGALPPLCVSFKLIWVLNAPLTAANRQWAADAWLLMATEFVLVHAGALSAAFAGVRGPLARFATLVVLAGFYTASMLAFWKLSGGSPIVAGAALLLAGRMISVAIGGAQAREGRLLMSFVSAALILFLVGATTVPTYFPMPAFTPDVLAQLRSASGGGQGLWIREPQRVITLGAFYFLALGVIELSRFLRSDGTKENP